MEKYVVEYEKNIWAIKVDQEHNDFLGHNF
jgi:hypothetical protein